VQFGIIFDHWLLQRSITSILW